MKTNSALINETVIARIDFIKLTINSYGGDVIAKLKKRLDAS